MNRRQFIDGTMATFGVAAFFLLASGGPEIRIREAGQDQVLRRLNYRIKKAFPGIEKDVHFVHAIDVVDAPRSIEFCILSAFGMSLSSLLSLDSERIRNAHSRRKNADLKSLHLVETQGYLLSMAEISLRQLFDQIDPR